MEVTLLTAFPRGGAGRREGILRKMKLPALAFTVTDWSVVPEVEHKGERGTSH
jgi:hypothetical protein